VELIVEARKDGLSPHRDFAARVNPRAINKRVIESLAPLRRLRRAGLQSRARFAGAEAILAALPAYATRPRRWDRTTCSAAPPTRRHHAAAVEPWLPAERLRREYDANRVFLSGHPLDDYATALKRLRCSRGRSFPAR